MAVDLANGTTITHGQLHGNAKSFDGGGEETPMVDASVLATTGIRPYVSDDIQDAEDFSVTVQFDPAYKPTTGGVASALVVTFPDASSWSCSAILKKYTFSGTRGEFIEGVFTFQRTTAWS